MVLLVLNSLYWSVSVESSAEIIQKASRQLAWLENQLELAKSRGQRVMLASHIPAGYVNNKLLMTTSVILKCVVLEIILTHPKEILSGRGSQ